MKIVYVVPIIAPYAIPRYEALAAIKDVEVHIIVERRTSTERAGWKYTEVPSCKVHMLDSKMATNYQIINKKNDYKMDKVRYYSIGLKKIIKKIKPDVVLVCNSTQILFLQGKRSYKLGVIVEDTLRAAESRPLLNQKIKKLMLGTADFYVPFSGDAVEFLKKNKLTKPQIKSYWSMDKEDFQVLDQDEITKYKEIYGMNSRINFILVAGLIQRKGILQFLKAWSKMGNKFKENTKLFIIGDGPLKPQIVEFISQAEIENVELVGLKPYNEVKQYYQCSDVFVLPTLEDLCSLSVLEAMAAGKPVLTTIYNGARQFILEGKNGYVFDPLTQSSICDVLQKVYEADLINMGQVSFDEVEKYSTKKIMNQLYKDICCLFDGEKR